MIAEIALDMFRGNPSFPTNFLWARVLPSPPPRLLSSPFLGVYSKSRINKDFRDRSHGYEFSVYDRSLARQPPTQTP